MLLGEYFVEHSNKENLLTRNMECIKSILEKRLILIKKL